jgi:hypothetical protein
MDKNKFVLDYINKNNLIVKDIFYENVIKNIQNENLYNENKDCYLITHLGLGDNISMSGVARYLTIFYNKVYVVVKNNRNYDNMKLLYSDNENIILISVDPFDERRNIINIINNLSENYDVFVSGFSHTSYIKSRISNKFLNKNKITNFLDTFKYPHIVNFFNDIHIDFKIYSTFFNIPETDSSVKLFNNIKNKNIIFVHSKASNKEISICLSEYIINDDFFIVCANKNYYDSKHNNFLLANDYVELPIINYITIIKNAKIIKIIDSSFACIIIPLQMKNELNTNNVQIINR